MKKTILVKVSTIFKPVRGDIRYVSGIGRSTYQMLKALSEIEDLPFDVRLYGAGLSTFYTTARDLPFKYNCFLPPESIGVRLTSLENYFISKVYKNDLLHIPHNVDPMMKSKMTFVDTVHDLYHYDKMKDEGNQKWIDLWNIMIYRSKGLVTCSEYTKQDILAKFNIPEEKVTVVPWGISLDMFKKLPSNAIRDCLSRLRIAGDYFLAVSCADPRKNIWNLLKAFRNYLTLNKEAKMVLLWSTPPKEMLDTYAVEINKGNIIFLNYVTDDELVALYNGAKATMYPSRYEGFGFPILESYACGTPVMTCKNSSLYEVGGDYSTYVGEDNIDEMTQVMEMYDKGLFDKKLFEQNVGDYVKKFTWSNTAKGYVNFYSKCLYE